MASEYPLININQIDLDALSTYLVHKNKLVYRNDAADDNADDTDKVCGVNADLIAVAVNKEDRQTIKNALELGGLPADEYMTITVGNTLSKQQEKLKKTQKEEIADLKDELYQLKAELLRNGAIENNGQYGGYTDPFRRNQYINIQSVVGTATRTGAAERSIIAKDTDTYNLFDKYDFICIVNKNNEHLENFEIRQIIEKDDATKSFRLNDLDAGVIFGDDLEIYKSKGLIHNGLYKFATITESLDDPYYNGLTDDSYIKTQRIQTSYTGYGCSFRVPKEQQGYVTKFQIGAKAKGNPGALYCYILDIRDIGKFKNAAQFAEDYLADKEAEKSDGIKFFAKSQPLTWTESEGKRYKYFKFQQDDGSYPYMSIDKDDEEPVRYVAIIECVSADQSNYYDLIFIQHKEGTGTAEGTDLETNNAVYTFTKKETDSTDISLETDENLSRYDLYHQIVTCPKFEGFAAYSQGLYTGHYNNQNLKYPATKARLMLRVKREGQYKVNIDNTEAENLKQINVVNENGDSYISSTSYLSLNTDTLKRAELQENQSDETEQITTVIGNNICKVNVSDTYVSVKDGFALVNNDDKVYRMNYLVSMKARRIEFNKTTGVYTISDYDHYVMPLINVFKDLNPSTRDYSDRLIFECDFTKTDEDGYLIPYNDFEFQIFWENQNMVNNDEIGKNIRNEQMAAIKDLVFSVDRGF